MSIIQYNYTLYNIHYTNGFHFSITILAVRKVSHLHTKTKMFDFEPQVLIGWLANTPVSQPIKTHASKSNIFVLMLRWPTFLAASILIYEKILKNGTYIMTTISTHTVRSTILMHFNIKIWEHGMAFIAFKMHPMYGNNSRLYFILKLRRAFLYCTFASARYTARSHFYFGVVFSNSYE